MRTMTQNLYPVFYFILVFTVFWGVGGMVNAASL